MADRCDGCGVEVPIAGGIADFWTFNTTETGGIHLELADGSDHVLCFECVEALPEEPTAADVEALGEADQ